MLQSDILGVVFVYSYVAILLFITEKILSKKYPVYSRKILHIMVGNIAFILPIFQTREIMAFFAAAPFIIITFFMSPYSPLKIIQGKTSKAGHGLGLIYYAVTWTILAYFFFDHKEIIAIGILAMSYGDGLASIIGLKYGNKKYKIIKERKSYIGSFFMFIFTLLLMIIALIYYNVSLDYNKALLLTTIAAISAIIEGLTPFGFDNLSVPLITAIIYWYAMVT